MIQLTVLYDHPQNPEAFDRHYQGTHVSLAKKIPALKGYTSARSTALSPQEQPRYYLIANLYFENMEALQFALQSPEGRAAASDLSNFATGGAVLVVGEVEVYDPVAMS
ncbi:EthD family reductase [Dictyobacter formicarum]|uniref:EthD domain-containing protein n=1 Tax=Dictyobacter formicarum TaxID=2778368 RepID=A0ABQ3VGW4_9CHLR|nr:EthD family reductase [Dictyobacter formicarum]GHO84949.1 hypothetical protein KSZ_29550 [Dictyobacter formicarum]